MSLSNAVPGAIIAAFFAQSSLTLVQTSATLLQHVVPPAIEGIGFVSAPVKAGEVALVQWQITKRTGCQGINSRVWSGVNGFSVTEEKKQTTLPATGKPEVYKVQTIIPQGAPPGPLSLTIQGEYKCIGSEPHSFVLGPVEMRVTE